MMTRKLNSQREKVVLCRGLKNDSKLFVSNNQSKEKTKRFQTHRPQNNSP